MQIISRKLQNLITVATVLSAAVIVNFENFFGPIQVGNLVRLFSKKIFAKLRRLIFKKIFTYLLKKIIIFKMRVSAIQWSKLFIPTHKQMYTSSTTTLQLCSLGPLGMHYQFSHFNNRGQWYSKVTNKIFTVLSSAVTNSGAVIKSGRQLIQSLR